MAPSINFAAGVGFTDDVSTPSCAPTGGLSDCHSEGRDVNRKAVGTVWSRLWSTTATLQLFPRSRRMRVAYDPACCAEFTDLTI